MPAASVARRRNPLFILSSIRKFLQERHVSNNVSVTSTYRELSIMCRLGLGIGT